MGLGAALLIVVVVLLVIYLVFYKSIDKKFIESVDIAQQACNTAIASQADADFALALTAISTAKLARSDSLNQYTNGAVVPADVTAASTKLDNISCSRYPDEQNVISFITNATAANAAVIAAPTADNIKTAQAAKQAADKAIDAAFSKPIISKALQNYAILYNKLDWKILSSSSTFNVSGTMAADDSCKVYVNGSLVFNNSNEWSTVTPWSLTGVKAGDQVDFEVTNAGGPAGLIAQWKTSNGNTYVTNTSTLSCVTPGYSIVEATYGWGEGFRAQFGAARWVWTDNTNATPAGTVRKFRWIAQA